MSAPRAATFRAGASARRVPPFVLPRLVRSIGERLPAFPPALVCALLLSAVGPRLFDRAALAEVEGKTLRITARDAGMSVAFRVRKARFEPLAGSVPTDVSIAACVADFLLLATRRVDPDTLFFERRLVIDGDTETGLRFKNMLDAVEWPRWARR